MRGHHGLRARSGRCCRDYIWPGEDGRRDHLRPAGRCRLGDLRGRCVTGRTSCSRFRRDGRGRGVSLWRGRRDDREATAPERCGRCRRSRGTPSCSRRFDRFRLRWPSDGVDRGHRWCDTRRNEHQAQLGHLNTSFLPGEAQARKSNSLAAERQAQQQSVNQQREQQRRSRSPAFRADALDRARPERGGLRRLLGWRTRWRCKRRVGARQTLRSWHCRFMLPGTNFKQRGRRPGCRVRRSVDACTPQLRQTASSFFDRVQRRFFSLGRASIRTSPTHYAAVIITTTAKRVPPMAPKITPAQRLRKGRLTRIGCMSCFG